MVHDGFRLIFSKQGGRIKARLPRTTSMQGARFSGGEWGLSLILFQNRRWKDVPSTAPMMLLMPGEESRGEERRGGGRGDGDGV